MTFSTLCLLPAFFSALGTGPVGAAELERNLPAVDVAASAAATGHGSHVEPSTKPAKGQFLVATRKLVDPHFAETVILLLAYEANGAMGLVINRPTEMPLVAALPKMKELRDRSIRLYVGGPVARESMLLLIRSATAPESSQRIFEDVYASGSLAALRQALGRKGKTERFRAFAGHAGWGAGQLDAEIARGAWYVATVDAATAFDIAPSEIWSRLTERLSGQWARGPSPGLAGTLIEPRN